MKAAFRALDRARVEIRSSDVHGIGVFALKKLNPGDVAFEYADIPDTVRIDRGDPRWKGVPPRVRTHLRQRFYFDKDTQDVPICGVGAIVFASFLNHSNEPNMVVNHERGIAITTRRVDPGEELLVDYRTFPSREYYEQNIPGSAAKTDAPSDRVVSRVSSGV